MAEPSATWSRADERGLARLIPDTLSALPQALRLPADVNRRQMCYVNDLFPSIILVRRHAFLALVQGLTRRERKDSESSTGRQLALEAV